MSLIFNYRNQMQKAIHDIAKFKLTVTNAIKKS